MGFFDKLVGKKGKETPKVEQPKQQTEPVNQDVSDSKPSMSEGFDYRKLFCHDLRLNVTAQKMGMSSEDFEKLFEEGNIEESKDGNGNKLYTCTINDFSFTVTVADKTVSTTVRKNLNDSKAQQVAQVFDRSSYLETRRLIQDLVLKSNGRYQSINQTLIERDPKRIEKVKFTHKRLRTYNECQAIEDSIDDVYRQIPGGSDILKEIEDHMRAIEQLGLDSSRTHQYYPSFADNTVLIKQLDLSKIAGDISTLEVLQGIDDSEVSRLAEARDFSPEEKNYRLKFKILGSSKSINYLRNMLYPNIPNAFGSLSTDYEIIDEYLDIVTNNFAKDREEADKQNQRADIFDANGELVSIYTENGETINRSTITRMIEAKKTQDRRNKEEAEKRANEIATYTEPDEYDFG